MIQRSIVAQNDSHILLPPNAGKNTRDRLQPFIDWLNDPDAGRHWLRPDLAAYRDYLLDSLLAPESVAAHLATIRGRYRLLLKDNSVRDALFAQLPDAMTFLEKKAYVDEAYTRLVNAIDPFAAPLSLTTKQDYEPHVRLTKHQARALMAAPGTATLAGLRENTAPITLLLCTGLREEETAHLDVADLYRSYEGFPALEVRRGKGNKQRMVLYGDLEWCLDAVRQWLVQGGIDEGAIFRGFRKNGTVKPARLNKRSVGYILAQYPIVRNGQPYTVTAHDLRYTYARLLHDAGMPIEAIAKNMGHASIQTTMIYVGDIGAHIRRPRNVYADNDAL